MKSNSLFIAALASRGDTIILPEQLSDKARNELADKVANHFASAEANNKATLESPVFKIACELAGIPVTKRQASKFNNGYGAAIKFRNAAREEVTIRREKLESLANGN